MEYKISQAFLLDMCLRMARTLTKIGKPQQSGEDNFMAINIFLNSKSKVLLFMLCVHHRLTVALPHYFLLTHARRLLLVTFKSMLTSIHVSLTLVDWDSLPLGQKESCTLERTEVATGLGFKVESIRKMIFQSLGMCQQRQ